MKIKINVVDAFTNVRFKGNPAAVVISGKWLSDEKMQEIAAENNLSETAFLVEDDNGWRIRYTLVFPHDGNRLLWPRNAGIRFRNL